MADRPNEETGPPSRGGTPTLAPGVSARPTSAQPPQPLRSVTDRLTTGVLLKHGHARFEFKAQGASSYFVTVQTERGERTLWGRGLERALNDSRTRPQPGDPIGVRENGIDPMTVILRERDAQGHVRLEKRWETPRGHWVIERREFFDERAAAAQALRDPRKSRREAVHDHPELIGAYWALDSASKVAQARIAHPDSRQRFVSLVREALALAAERGEPLPSPRTSTRTAARVGHTQVPRAPEDPSRTR
jgi:hypothetical protein